MLSKESNITWVEDFNVRLGKLEYQFNDANLRLEKIEYCLYRRTRSGQSEIERLKKEFEEMREVKDVLDLSIMLKENE
jgi:hypothetical protein